MGGTYDSSKNLTQDQINQFGQYIDFLNNNKGGWEGSIDDSMKKLKALLTANGYYPFKEYKMRMEVVELNQGDGYPIKEDMIERIDFLEHIQLLPQNDLIKTLAFPYSIQSYTGGTHGSGGGLTSIPWLIQADAKIDKNGITPLYSKMIKTIFDIDNVDDIQISFHMPVEDINEILKVN